MPAIKIVTNRTSMGRTTSRSILVKERNIQDLLPQLGVEHAVEWDCVMGEPLGPEVRKGSIRNGAAYSIMNPDPAKTRKFFDKYQ